MLLLLSNMILEVAFCEKASTSVLRAQERHPSLDIVEMRTVLHTGEKHILRLVFHAADDLLDSRSVTQGEQRFD